MTQPVAPDPSDPAGPSRPTEGLEPLGVPWATATEPVRPLREPSSAQRRFVTLAGYLVAAAVGAAILFAGLGAAGGLGILRPTPAPSPSRAYMQGLALGDPSTAVTIEVWADYQCPYCGLQARGVEPSIERILVATGRARLVYRDFAFLGQESVAAAVAARCAGREGAYWYYHDLLFSSQQGENQGAFARERLISLAGFAGLDATAFAACLDDTTVAAVVQAETQTGRGYGISSTPTIRVTGPGGSELLTGVKPLAQVVAAVDRMSRPAPSGGPSASSGPAVSGSPAPPGPSAPSAGPSASAPAASSPVSASSAPSAVASPSP